MNYQNIGSQSIEPSAFRSVVVRNNDIDSPAVDFSENIIHARSAFKFATNCPDANSYVTFGTNQNPYEYVWNSDTEEKYIWRYNEGDALTVTKDGVRVKNLIVSGNGNYTDIVASLEDVAKKLNDLTSKSEQNATKIAELESQAKTFATKAELYKEINNLAVTLGEFNYAPKSYVDECVSGISIPDMSTKLEITAFTEYAAETAIILDELQNKKVDDQPPKIYYQDTAPETDLVGGDIWIDSTELRLNVRHGDYWMSPDRVEDKPLKEALFNAAQTTSSFETFKIKLMAALI